MRNGRSLGRVARARGPWRWVNGAVHAFNRNSRSGAKRNILSHYDLGKDSYHLWPDAGLHDSSAIFVHPYLHLEEPKDAKVDTSINRTAPVSCGRLLEHETRTA